MSFVFGPQSWRDARGRPDLHEILATNNIEVQRTNSTSAINVLNETVFGGSMGPNGIIRWFLAGRIFNNSGSNKVFRYTVTFGGNTYYQDRANIASSSAGSRSFYGVGMIANKNVDAGSFITGYFNISQAGNADTGQGDFNGVTGIQTATAYGRNNNVSTDTTVDQTLLVQTNMNSTAAGVTLVHDFASLELIRGF